MHLKALAVGIALSAGCALAQDLNDPVQSSIFSVLRTAIPEDIQLSAFSNPSSFGAEVASSISAGNPPAWYTALPADVKSALPSLYPAAVVTTPTATPTPTAASSESESAASSSSGTPSETGSSTVASTTTTETSSGTPSGTAGESGAPESTGAASVPSAALGAGVAGLMGMVGMLVL